MRVPVLLSILLLAGCATPPAMTQVRVFNAQFEQVRSITDAAQVASIDSQWQLTEMDESADPPCFSDDRFTLKVDLYGGEHSGRWLYDRAGYATLLSKAKSPIYRISDPAAFERALGL